MKLERIEILMSKYMTNSITASELNELAHYWESPKHKILFEQYVKINYTANQIIGSYNIEKAKEELLNNIKEDKRSLLVVNMRSFFKYAAILVLFLGLGYYFKKDILGPSNDYNRIVKNDNPITLTLDDGSLLEVVENGVSSLLNAKGEIVGIQKNGQLSYNNSNFYSKKYAYNTLKIPNGKKSYLVLSDGTKIHLNSGTSITYPVGFKKGEKRQIFLEGEAYFDVAQDKGSPFVVNSNELNIRVLGTKFNVSTYSDDSDGNTVLVEGSVGLYWDGEDFTAENSPLLNPGYKVSWKKLKKDLEFEQVDTDIYTAWVQGKIIFIREPFKDIIKKLERKYNVEIINNNQLLNEEIFTASFDTETIEQILSAFNKNYPINYEIKNNQIIIN